MRAKYFIIVVSLLLNIFACSGKSDLPTKDFTKTWDGWGGHPESPNKMPFDYYYLKYPSRASEKSIKKKSGELMKQSCMELALLGKGDVIGKMIGEIVYRYTCDEQWIGKFLVRNYFQGIKVNRTECKPMAVPIPSIPQSEYRECECILYTHVPGGREYIINLQKEVEAEYN